MLELYQIISILFIHWFADFVLQTDKQAKGKSSSNLLLFQHCLVYSGCWIPFLYYEAPDGLNYLGLFILITFISHFVTDYITSRINSYYWKQGNNHNFFVSVGFDQFLHYTQLFLTFALLK